jgi:Aminoglycoside-2''-adenylyltransferase
MSEEQQLSALARLHELFLSEGIDYWLFGGWAVDFHAGSVTRHHGDLDLAVWLTDLESIESLLAAEAWEQTFEAGQDGFVSYRRAGVRLEIAFLVRGDDGKVYTPLQEGRASWPDGAFGEVEKNLQGQPARVMGLAALKVDKAEEHEGATAAAKDRDDLATLEHLQ